MNVIFIRPFLVVMNLVLICVTVIAFSDKSEDLNEHNDNEFSEIEGGIHPGDNYFSDDETTDGSENSMEQSSDDPNNSNSNSSKKVSENGQLTMIKGVYPDYASRYMVHVEDLNNQKLQLALQGVIDLNRDGKSKERIPHSQKIYLQYYKEDQELRKEHLKLQEAYAISDKILEEKKLRMAQLKEKYRQATYPKYSNEKALRIQK